MFAFCFAVGAWASSWGHSFLGFFFLTLILSPIISAIILIAMGKTVEVKAKEFAEMQKLMGVVPATQPEPEPELTPEELEAKRKEEEEFKRRWEEEKERDRKFGILLACFVVLMTAATIFIILI